MYTYIDIYVCWAWPTRPAGALGGWKVARKSSTAPPAPREPSFPRERSGAGASFSLSLYRSLSLSLSLGISVSLSLYIYI